MVVITTTITINNFLYLKKKKKNTTQHLCWHCFFPSLFSTVEPELNLTLTLDRLPGQHGMLEPALLLRSQHWQFLVCFLAAARSGSAALSLCRKQVLSNTSHCIPLLAVSLRLCELPSACGPAAVHHEAAQGCGAMAEAVTAALLLRLSLGAGSSPAPSRTVSPPSLRLALLLLPQEQPFLGQCHLTVWVKRGEFVLKHAGGAVSPQPTVSWLATTQGRRAVWGERDQPGDMSSKLVF